MTRRERFCQTILFGKPDKIPFSPGHPRVSTLEAWSRQGLAKNKDYYQALLEILKIEPEKSKERVNLEISFKMIPEFEEKILEHKNGHLIVQDCSGAIVEISDKYDFTYLRYAKDFVTRKWHKFPVENISDWNEMKKRYNPKTTNRYPDDFNKKCEMLKDRDYEFGIHINGPFWQLREWCGLENLCMMMLEQPEFVEEMISFWTDFVIEVMQPLLSKVELDFVTISEDIAYKGKSMISPSMVRRFLLPSYQRWTSKIRENKCKIISMDSDGYIGELIPIWIECGINCCSPVEVAAGNDIVRYRKIYGKNMAFMGGIDKRAIAKGGKVMENEVIRVVPPLLKDGGFIPSCDHAVPPDISWQNYIEYSRLLAKLTGWI